eukprot:996384-Rhodomonas_salina.1
MTQTRRGQQAFEIEKDVMLVLGVIADQEALVVGQTRCHPLQKGREPAPKTRFKSVLRITDDVQVGQPQADNQTTKRKTEQTSTECNQNGGWADMQSTIEGFSPRKNLV